MDSSASENDFPDLEGPAYMLVAEFTGLNQPGDPAAFDSLRSRLQHAWQRMEQQISGHGGVLAGRFGGSLMAVWRNLQSGEEDAVRCVECALALHEAMSVGEGAGLSLRIGIAAGPVLAAHLGADQAFTVIGEPAETARRLAEAAGSGATLLAPGMYQHVAENFQLRRVEGLNHVGRGRTTAAYLVEARRDRSPHSASVPDSLETRMVDRDEELQALLDLHDSLELAADPFLVLVVGSSGLGKSRLLFEFATDVQAQYGRMVLSSRGLPEAHRIPFFFWKSLWKDRLGILDNVPEDAVADNFLRGVLALWGKRLGQVSAVESAHLVGDLLGVRWKNSRYLSRYTGDPAAQKQRAFALVRELLIRLSDNQPMALVVDDLQYLDAGSLQLLASLLQPGPDALPLMVLAGVQDSFLAEEPDWRQRAYRQVVLRPVDFSSEQIRTAYPAAADYPEPLLARMGQRAGGNPLYMEEIVKSIVASQESEAAVRPPSVASAIPGTLAGMLKLRMDSLSSRAREVLQLASVTGRVFWVDAVQAAARQPVGTGLLNLPEGELERVVREGLQEAVEAELAFPYSGSTIAGETAYIFKHPLLQAVSYDILPEKYRKFYHFAVAKWLSERCGPAWSIVIAEHFEKSGSMSTALRYYQYAADYARARGCLTEVERLDEYMNGVRSA